MKELIIALLSSIIVFGQASDLSLLKEGDSHFKNSKYAEAISCYNKYLSLIDKSRSDYKKTFSAVATNLSKCMDKLAAEKKERGIHSEAANLYLESLSIKRIIYTSKEDLEVLADDINKAAAILDEFGMYAETECLFKEALEIRRRIYKGIDHGKLKNSIYNIATFYHNQSLFLDALPFYKENLEIHRRIFLNKKDKRPLLGSIDAFSLFNEQRLLAFSIADLADCLKDLSRYSEAEPLYREGLEIMRDISQTGEGYTGRDHVFINMLLSKLAIIYDAQDRPSEAEPLYRQSLDIMRNIYPGRDNSQLASSIGNMAQFLTNQGRYSEAEPLFLEYLAMERRIYFGSNDEYLATCINNTAVFLNAQGRYSEAEPLYKEALEMRRRIYKGFDHEDLALGINNMAIFLDAQGRHSEAEPLYKEAIEMRRRIYKDSANLNFAYSIFSMASFLNSQRRYSEAEPLYRKSLDMMRTLFGESEREDMALFTNNLASFLNDQGRCAEAEPLYIQANDLYVRLLKGYFYFLSEKEKEEYLYKYRFQFELYNSFFINRYIPSHNVASIMYDNRLLLKGIITSSITTMRSKILAGNDSTLLKLYDKWTALMRLVTKYQTKLGDELKKANIDLARLVLEANNYEKELSRKAEYIFDERNQSKITWDKIRSVLKNDEAAIEIIRIRQYSGNRKWADAIFYAALIVTKETREHPELVILRNGNELECEDASLYKKWINRLGKGLLDSETDTLLYRKYWGVIADKIRDKKKIYLSGDGVYNQINLEVLKNGMTGKYVNEEHEIILMTSTRDLVTSKRTCPVPDKRAVFFGNPRFDLSSLRRVRMLSDIKMTQYDIKGAVNRGLLSGMKLAELKATEEEVYNISKKVKNRGWKTQVYTDTLALEELVKAVKHPKVLHLATHGKFLSSEEVEKRANIFGSNSEFNKNVSTNPLMRSMLFFSGAQNSIDDKNELPTLEDGILTAQEVVNMDLAGTELVVLSACETGLGETISGQGVMNLQRCFQVAGAQNVIMSMWPVDDNVTKEQMQLFYDEWLKGGNIRHAFKSMQNKLKRKYQSPYFWGAFVLIGE